jgi:hypothetical protein
MSYEVITIPNLDRGIRLFKTDPPPTFWGRVSMLEHLEATLGTEIKRWYVGRTPGPPTHLVRCNIAVRWPEPDREPVHPDELGGYHNHVAFDIALVIPLFGGMGEDNGGTAVPGPDPVNDWTIPYVDEGEALLMSGDQLHGFTVNTSFYPRLAATFFCRPN